jgi:hypothetical protein
MNDQLWATIVAERIAEAWLASDHPEWHGGHEAAREIAGLLREKKTPPQLSVTAVRMLRTLRDVQCSSGEPVRMRMLDSGGYGWISWHAGYVSGPQSLTVRRATFERLHRLKLIEYDKGDSNGGKLYKLTPLGAAALQVYDLNNNTATNNEHKSAPS